MALLQGSSYVLPIKITEKSGQVVTGDVVVSNSFTIGNITKEAVYNSETQMWEVPLTEEETFGLDNKNVEWQARFKFVGGRVDGTVPKEEYVYQSVNKVKLSGGGKNA